MKKFLKILKWAGIGILIVIVGFVIFVYARANRTFEAPYPECTASLDSSLIARREYMKSLNTSPLCLLSYSYF